MTDERKEGQQASIKEQALKLAFALRDEELIGSYADDIPDVTVKRWAERIALFAAEPRGSEALDEFKKSLDIPELEDFCKGVVIEAAHQRKRWGDEHDASKAPEDWFWVIGYLAGKAMNSQKSGDMEKFKHHLITGAALLANWHARVTGKLPALAAATAEKETQAALNSLPTLEMPDANGHMVSWIRLKDARLAAATAERTPPDEWSDGYDAGLAVANERTSEPLQWLEEAFSAYKVALKALYEHRYADRQPASPKLDAGVREEIKYRMNLRPGQQGYEAAEALYFTAHNRGWQSAIEAAEQANCDQCGMQGKFWHPADENGWHWHIAGHQDRVQCASLAIRSLLNSPAARIAEHLQTALAAATAERTPPTYADENPELPQYHEADRQPASAKLDATEQQKIQDASAIVDNLIIQMNIPVSERIRLQYWLENFERTTRERGWQSAIKAAAQVAAKLVKHNSILVDAILSLLNSPAQNSQQTKGGDAT